MNISRPAGVRDTLNGQPWVRLDGTFSEQAVVVFLHQFDLGSLSHGYLDRQDWNDVTPISKCYQFHLPVPVWLLEIPIIRLPSRRLGLNQKFSDGVLRRGAERIPSRL